MRRALAGKWDAPIDMAGAVERVSKEDVIACAKALEPDTVYLLEGRKGGEIDD